MSITSLAKENTKNGNKLSNIYNYVNTSVIKKTKISPPVIKSNAPPLMFVSIIPSNLGKEEFTAQHIINRYKKTGITTYALNYSLHPAGNNVMAKPNSYVPSFSKLQQLLAHEPDIKLGILLQSTLGHGGYWNKTTQTNLPGQKMVNLDGSLDHRFCPFEENFINYITKAVGLLAKLEPKFMIIDDDLRIPGKKCFCPYHINKLNKITGQNFTRETLSKHLENAPAFDKIAQSFYKINVKSIGLVAKAIRQTIDLYNPSILVGYCVAAPLFETAIEVLKNAGGKNPLFLRLSNSYYLENAIKTQADKDLLTAFQTINFSKELNLPLIDESDTCPHDRYSKSSRTMNLHIVSGILHGCRGGKLWFDSSTLMVGNEFEATFAKYHNLYRELAKLMQEYTPEGAITCIPPFNREPDIAFGHKFYLHSDWGKNLFSKLGIPFAYGNMEIKDTILIAGNQVDYYTSDELNKMLTKTVILDGSAAIKLTRRGFQEKIGVHATVGKKTANNEIILNNNIPCRFSSQDNYAELKLLKNAKVLSKLCYNKEEVLPGSVFFNNSLGGRVVTVSFDLEKTIPMNLVNPSRKIFFTDILEQLDCLPGVITAFQDAKLSCGKLKDNRMLWSIINYSYDPLNLEFATRKQINKILELMPDGSYKEIKFTLKNNKLALKRKALEPGEFAIIVLE